jgi:predicted Fe-Mo cluster-binding NifX family protein
MLVAVSSMGTDLDALTGSPFGSCPQFLVVDSDTMEYVVVSVPDQLLDPSRVSGNAIRGIAKQGAEMVITGPIKHICREAIQSLGMRVVSDIPRMTVRSAILRYAVRQQTEPVPIAETAEMIAVSSHGDSLDSKLAGRTEPCTSFLLVDAGTMQFRRLEVGAALSTQQGSLHALRAAVRAGATVVITTNMSPPCCAAARALAVSVVLAEENSSVRQAVWSYLAGQLQTAQSV